MDPETSLVTSDDLVLILNPVTESGLIWRAQTYFITEFGHFLSTNSEAAETSPVSSIFLSDENNDF